MALSPSTVQHQMHGQAFTNTLWKPVLTVLGDVVRASRLKLGLSQEALAVDAELDRSYVGGIDRGEHNLTLINLQKIANALGTKPSVLLKAAGN